MICGLRQIGKSHIMFHLAARMLAEVGVVVVYVGDASSLIVDGSPNDYLKYERFVRYVAAAFSEYPQINAIVEKWYFDTDLGKRISELRSKTSDFLCQLRTLCDEEPQGITPVFFIDSYEKMVNALPSHTIVTVHELAYTYGFLVTLSTTELFDPESQHLIPMNICTLSIPLSEIDATNVLVATHSNLRMTRSIFKRLYEASDYHVYDFERLLKMCNAFSSLSADDIQKAINGYDIHRRMRLSDMHSWFYNKHMDAVLLASGEQQPINLSSTNCVLKISTPELRKEHRKMGVVPFMLYHNLNLPVDAVFDRQFISKNTSLGLFDSIHSLNNNEETNHNENQQKLTCCPMAAIETMYNFYFNGTVMKQFSWLLEEARYKIEIDPLVRTRLFDLLFLETERLEAKATNPLTHKTWDIKMNFSPVTMHNFKVYSHIQNPRGCNSFEKAVQYVTQHIRDTRGKRSLDLYDETSDKEVRSTLVIYLPDIKFEDWPDRSISTDSSFAGSFMVAVTRVDIPSCPASRCQYELTWIASDPLRAVSIDEKIEAPLETAPSQQDIVIKNCFSKSPSSRDTRDFDKIHGYSQSWTAKAIRIFPTLKEMCQKAIPEDALRNVRMLTLTYDGRAKGILEQNQLTTLEPELAKYNCEFSRDIGIIQVGELEEVNKQIKHYL
ncbi:hypothetical protein GGI05_001656 [Coemansia sp. RSA 2603]|nr:hypothetical protein GGI05_001656 [Coemansia sp. RSA 2603]